MYVKCFVGVLLFACAVAAAVLEPSGDARAETTGNISQARVAVHVPSDIVVTEAHIFLIKFALRLRPEQEPYWAPVEGALRDLARRQATAKVGPASVGRHADRAATGDLVATRLRQIAVLARPLLKALDHDQRRNMLSLARTAGLEQLLTSR
jgi:hypothetical protein